VPSSSTSPKNLPSGARDLLASNIVRLRSELGWSQETLALEAGLHRTFIAHVERKARNISVDNIELIAKALGVSVAELLSNGPK
jgi:transcriptional regulator with XRE-family HTH domain